MTDKVHLMHYCRKMMDISGVTHSASASSFSLLLHVVSEGDNFTRTVTTREGPVVSQRLS